jgi:S-layer homology domain
MKKILFSVVASVTLIGTTFAYTFTDLQSANSLAQKGYIVDNSQTPDNYRLGDTITRKEIMKVIAKIGSASLSDVCEWKFNDVENDWGCKYIEWALGKWIIAANRNFRPNDNITQAEAMKMILKVKGIALAYSW